MKFTANQIAELLNGEIVGNENAEVFTLSQQDLWRERCYLDFKPK